MVSTEETVEEMAARLVREGWRSTSNKYFHIARWTHPVPKAADILTPEQMMLPHGARMARMWDEYRSHYHDLRGTDKEAEHCVLTEEQFKAFRKAGGQSA